MSESTVLDVNGTFDWLLSYRTHGVLKSLLDSVLQRFSAPSILVVGSGRSTLSEDLFDNGYGNVVSVDNSKDCIDFMRHRTRHMAGLKWAEVDLQQAGALESYGEFDVVIDKSTLDAIVCVGDRAACRMVWNVVHALKPHGMYVVVSCHHGQPVQRFLTPSTLALTVKPTEIVVPSCFKFNAFECCKTEITGRCTFEAYLEEVIAMRKEESSPLAESIKRRVKEGFEARVADGFYMNGCDNSSVSGSVSGSVVVKEERQLQLDVEKAYDFMFSTEEKREYCMEDFHGDLLVFHGGTHVSRLTQHQALAFLEAMQ